MGKWRQGLKIDLGATKQRTTHFNLAHKIYPAQPFFFKGKFAKSAFFHHFASFQVNKCRLYGKMETGD